MARKCYGPYSFATASSLPGPTAGCGTPCIRWRRSDRPHLDPMGMGQRQRCRDKGIDLPTAESPGNSWLSARPAWCKSFDRTKLACEGTMMPLSCPIPHQGATWYRRGLRTSRCMSRRSTPRKSNCKLIVANDDNYALAA